MYHIKILISMLLPPPSVSSLPPSKFGAIWKTHLTVKSECMHNLWTYEIRSYLSGPINILIHQARLAIISVISVMYEIVCSDVFQIYFASLSRYCEIIESCIEVWTHGDRWQLIAGGLSSSRLAQPNRVWLGCLL